MRASNTGCWYSEVCGKYNTNCPAGCIRYTEMKYLMEHSNLPENRRGPQVLHAPDCDLAAYRRLAEIKRKIVDFVQKGDNLYICSENTGNGKTSWSIKLMLSYFDKIWDGNGLRQRAIYLPITWFLLKCKDFKRTDYEFEELKESLLTVDLVVWDDLCSTRLSDYDYTNLLMYIDARTTNCQANIFTGNIISKSDMQDRLGSKMTDRIWSKSTEIITFKGVSER